MSRLAPVLIVLALLTGCAISGAPDVSGPTSIVINGRNVTQGELRALLASAKTRPMALELMARQAGASHAWDEFRDDSGNMTWRCRHVQSGEFDDDTWCAAKARMDTHWPGPHGAF